ncbi:hypothetical protein AGR6A_Lc130009 [Agrobacterium sp. NCPPB 925]|nr:hypothetical protein AGR6A_Lc130009 [Agrobacterium sp. NCPPB 925]
MTLKASDASPSNQCRLADEGSEMADGAILAFLQSGPQPVMTGLHKHYARSGAPEMRR